MCAVVEVHDGRLVLYCGTERTEILVRGLTGYTDAYLLVSHLKKETEEEALKEWKGRGNPAWRLKRNPTIGFLQKVLECEDFVEACRTANPAQFEDMECDSTAAASATPVTVTPVTAAPKKDVVLAKLQELEAFTNSIKSKKGTGSDIEAVQRKVDEVQALCFANGVSEWDLDFYLPAVKAILVVHEKQGKDWKDASTRALSAWLPSFAHIQPYKLRKDQVHYSFGNHERGLTVLHKVMRLAKTAETAETGRSDLEVVLSHWALEEVAGSFACRGQQCYCFDLLPLEMQKKPDIFIWRVGMNPSAIRLTDDQDLVERALRAHPEALEWADQAYQRDLFWLQHLLSNRPNFDLQLLKGGGEVVSEILQGASNFTVSVADFALSRPRQILTISHLELAENEPECVNLCVSNVGGGASWGRDNQGHWINVPVNFGWKTTYGIREWLRNYLGEPIYDWSIITPEGNEGNLMEEATLIDFDLQKWASLVHMKKTLRMNPKMGTKKKDRTEKKQGQGEE